MAGAGSLSLGDPCFAKVKGFLPYPAKIVEVKVKSNKLKYAVVFYGDNKTADIVSEFVWKITDQTVKKFVNPKSLKKKVFKLGYDEMMEFHKLDHGGERVQAEVEAIETDVDDDPAGEGENLGDDDGFGL